MDVIHDENLRLGSMLGQSPYSDPLFGTKWVCLLCISVEEFQDANRDTRKLNEEHIITS